MPFGPRFDATDTGVTVLDRCRELAVLERRAHTNTLAVGHSSGEDKRLRATADTAEERLHHHLVVRSGTQNFAAYLSPTGRNDPERSRFVGHAPSF